MEIRVYKVGEVKRLELVNTAARLDQQFIDIDEFRDISVVLQKKHISILSKGEKIVRADWSDYKNKAGQDLGTTPNEVADKVTAILKSRVETDSYVIGDDLSEKSSETIFTHNKAGTSGLGGRLIVDDENAKVNVTRSAGQGTTGLEVLVTGTSGSDLGSIIGKGNYSNATRTIFTAQAATGQLYDSLFTVHDRFEVEGEANFLDSININGNELSITDLGKVPSSLGSAGQVLAVNSGGTALEFVNQSGGGGGGSSTLIGLTDTPSSFSSAGQVLVVNSARNAMEFAAPLEIGTTSTTALAGDTITITTSQALQIASNASKVSFPGFGTTSGTALEGNTSLFSGAFGDLTGRPTTISGYGITDALQLGTTSTTALAGDTTTITSIQASAITANTAKTSFPGFGTTSGTALEGNTSLFDGVYASLTGVPSTFTPSAHTHTASEITDFDTEVSNNSSVTANTAKTSFPGFGTTAGTALEGDTALLQLGTTSTTALAGNTTTISSAQASAITANTAKTSFPGFGTTSTTALAGDTTTITSAQASAITANTAKTSFPGFGTTSGTALEGNTSLFDGAYSSLTGIPSSFTPSAHNQAWTTITGTPTTISGYGITDALQLGSTSTTALAGDTTTITSAQASAITANTAKTSFPGFGTSAGTALEGNTSLFDGAYSSLTGAPTIPSDITDLGDTPASLGTSGQVLAVDSGGTALEFVDQSGGGGGSTPMEINYARLRMSTTVLNGGASAQDFNSASYVVAKFDVEEDNDGTQLTSDTVTDNKITVASDGLYRLSTAITFTAAAARVTPSVSFNINQVRIIGEAYGYIRASSGQNENACNLTRVIALSAGDEIQVCAHDTSTVSGSCFAVEAIFEVEKLGGSVKQQTLEGTYLEVVTRNSPYTSGDYEGKVIKFGTGTLSAGKIYVLRDNAGAALWDEADADAEIQTKGLLGMALGTSPTDDGLLVRGISTLSNSFTVGAPLYISLTSGTMTDDLSSHTTGDFVRAIGYALSTQLVYLDPSPDYIELA